MVAFKDTYKPTRTPPCEPQNAHPREQLQKAGYRYYSSEIGRWANRDPLGEGGGLNVYGFLRNDAWNHQDKLGLVPVVPFLAKVAGKCFASVAFEILKEFSFKKWDAAMACNELNSKAYDASFQHKLGTTGVAFDADMATYHKGKSLRSVLIGCVAKELISLGASKVVAKIPDPDQQKIAKHLMSASTELDSITESELGIDSKVRIYAWCDGNKVRTKRSLRTALSLGLGSGDLIDIDWSVEHPCDSKTLYKNLYNLCPCK